MRIYTMLIAASLALLTGCPSTAQVCAECNPPPTECEGCESFDIEVALAPGGDIEGAGLLHLILYGVDTGIADQSANVIAEWTVEVTEFPATIPAVIPADAHDHIDPTTGDESGHVFYLDAWLDTDGDGELCVDDLDDVDGEPAFLPPASGAHSVELAVWDGECIEL